MTPPRFAWFAAGLVAGIALTLALTHGTPVASAAAGNTSRVVLENDRVRVKEAIFQPDTPHPGMHTHELPHVGIIIDGGKMIFRSPDGTTETMDMVRGGVGYRAANVTHEPVNVGTAPVRVIEVELK